MADQVSQGGITVAASPNVPGYRVNDISQGGITVPSQLVDPTVQVSQGGITIASCGPISAPTGFAAVVNGNDIVLTWTDNETTNDYYRVDYSADNISWSTLTSTVAGDAETYTHSNVLVGAGCGEDFYYRLYTIVEGLCDGVYTPASTSLTLAAPADPTGLSATLSDTNVVLTWTDNSADETGFVVQRSTNGVDFSTIATVGAGVVAYTDTDAAPGTRYYYRVSATIAACASGYTAIANVFVAPLIEEPCPPVAVYQLILYDKTGTRLAIIDDYRSLQYGHQVNGVGFFSLQMSYYDSKRTLFDQDYILEVRRKIPGYKDWYREFIGHCEDFSRTFYANGNTQFTVVGSGFNGLLGRVIIGYEDGSSQSNKDDAAETVMKEYVRENRGDLATPANSREADGRILSFYVEGDTGSGNTWSGERAGKKLLETLQDIANFSGIDFNVEVHPTLGIGSYLFKTYEGQLGTDRTTDGLDPTTGLNASGYVPHVFSLERGNIDVARLQEKHKPEINRVYIFGQDKTTGLSTIRTRETSSAISSDNLSLREAMRGGTSQTDTDAMDSLGDEYLEQNQFVEKFEATPVDQPSSLYGVHFTIGDRVTFKLGDVERNKRLTRVSVTVSGDGGGESNKQFEFGDVP